MSIPKSTPKTVRGLWAFAILCAAVLYGYGAAQPPWEKPVGAWTADDVTALLNNSPWSVRAGATLEDPEDKKDPEPVGPPDTGSNNGAPKAHWDGEIVHNRMGKPPVIPVLVRWESALPIRQAQKDTSAPAESYVISVSGLVPAGEYRAEGKTATSSSSDGSFDARNPEEVLEAFMAYSKISLGKSGAEIGPENVKLDPATGVVRIFFPRKTAIDAREKEAVFITHFGKLHVVATFRLASMKYRGSIEL